MQLAICLMVKNTAGGFDVSELNRLLEEGYTVNNAYASTDNSLLVVLDSPKDN